jgi:hypothetical protein
MVGWMDGWMGGWVGGWMTRGHDIRTKVLIKGLIVPTSGSQVYWELTCGLFPSVLPMWEVGSQARLDPSNWYV